jgi:DNA-binding response OmpR family regulator
LIGIVDDDPIMGESLVQRLQLEGYQAIWWQSGEEALSTCSTDCRVLVCDIRLPGPRWRAIVQRALPDLGATPVIFITAFGEVGRPCASVRAGADDYVTSPFPTNVLLEDAALCAGR